MMEKRIFETTSMRSAVSALARAVEGPQSICHIVTDDFMQAVRIADQVFFHRDLGSRQWKLEEEYFDLSAKIVELDGGCMEWRAAARHATGRAVYYLCPGKDGLTDAQLREMIRYDEYVGANGKHGLQAFILLYGSAVELPPRLARCTAHIHLPPLAQQDFAVLLRDAEPCLSDADVRFYADWLAGYDEKMLENIIRVIREASPEKGLTDFQLAKKCIVQDKNNYLRCRELICETDDESEALAGYQRMQDWLRDEAPVFHEDRFAVNDPKHAVAAARGVLLVGPPGVGKSAGAKYASRILNLPRVKLSSDLFLRGHVGESEQRFRMITEDLQFLSPAVVYIDEVEKFLAGSTPGSSGDSGVMQRIFGEMLDFMQRQKGLFFAATANDTSNIQDAFFRRFSKCFALMLPSEADCLKIVQAKLKRYGIEDQKFAQDFLQRIQRRGFLTGANISDCVDALMRRNRLHRSGGDGVPDTPVPVTNPLKENADRLLTLLEKEVLHHLNPYGAGVRGMESLAAVHCAILNHSFTPADGGELFSAERYHPERVQDYVYSAYGDLPSCMDAPPNAPAKDSYDARMFAQICAQMDRCIARRSDAKNAQDYRRKWMELQQKKK